MAHAAQRGLVWIRRWRGAVSVVALYCCLIDVVQFSFVIPIKSLRLSSVSGLELFEDWWGEFLRKVVVDFGGFRGYYRRVIGGLGLRAAPYLLGLKQR